MPPAFALSQDQTLRFIHHPKPKPNHPKANPPQKQPSLSQSNTQTKSPITPQNQPQAQTIPNINQTIQKDTPANIPKAQAPSVSLKRNQTHKTIQAQSHPNQTIGTQTPRHHAQPNASQHQTKPWPQERRQRIPSKPYAPVNEHQAQPPIQAAPETKHTATANPPNATG